MISVQHSSFTMDYEKVTDCKVCVTADVMRESKVFKANGRAVCSPEDEFNIEFGRQLSKIRALQKAYKKIEKELIRYSYKNSRKKIYMFNGIDKIQNYKIQGWGRVGANELYRALVPPSNTFMMTKREIGTWQRIERLLKSKGVYVNE